MDVLLLLLLLIVFATKIYWILVASVIWSYFWEGCTSRIGFYSLAYFRYQMALKLRCEEYGFECKFVIDGEETLGSISNLRDHFDDAHGIDYTIEAVTQMIANRGYSLKSIKK